jgi:Undecaprenyl-phosphate glucose phosphotransferase
VLKRYYQVFGSLLVVTDAIGLIAAWLLAYYLRFYTQIVPVTKGIPPWERYVAVAVPVVLLWLGVFFFFRLYGSGRIMRRTTELGMVLRAHFVALVLFVLLTWVISEYRFSRVTVGFFAVLAGAYLLGSRLALRNFLRQLGQRGHRKRLAVILGSGATALAAWERIRRMPELGLHVAGCFTDDKGPLTLSLPVLGSLKEAPLSLAAMAELQEVLIALPAHQAALQEQLLGEMGDAPWNVSLVPDLQEYLVLGCTVEDFDQLPVVRINSSTIDPLGAFLKRSLDVMGAALALLIFAPFFLLISLFVKLSSRGPIFYGQERMSVDGSTFRMWKFRSMRVNAEAQTGAVWAKKNDDRRTTIGTFLRASSLDELPQFWNVLVGDMSLVGPRPERPEFVQKFRGSIPYYMLRHKVKAGITGWAQVNGWRGDTSLEKRIECDLYYIRHWSLGLDLKILLLTPWRGFIHKNAY